ncbi:Uncharacterised protein [Burkholderia pseudomallei]|nr:Uncharacterised protein [Burkholderia pseudomallei]
MHDPYHPAGRPRADERPAARRATPVRIRHMLLHFGAIGRGPGDARRCPRGAARGRAPMNRTASDSADCAAPFRPTPDAAMHAGSPAVHRSAARRGAETSKRAGTINSSHRRDFADRRERHRFRTHGMPRARVAMRRGTAGRHAASRRDSARRRARVPRISAIDPAPPPKRSRSTVAPLSGKPAHRGHHFVLFKKCINQNYPPNHFHSRIAGLSLCKKHPLNNQTPFIKCNDQSDTHYFQNQVHDQIHPF